MSKQVAVVTGANRGIGFEICRQLAQKDISVILTSRDLEKGKRAQERLAEDDIQVDFHQLDVADWDSIRNFKSWLLDHYGRVDILVNNAGVLLDKGDDLLNTPPGDFLKTLEINTVGAYAVTQALVPLMQKNGYGRIVMMSSGMGAITRNNNSSIAYSVSKTAMNGLTVMLAGALGGSGILINAMSPGWVHTEMGGSSAPRTPEEGADTAVWLATLPVDGPNGKFFRDREEIDW